MLIGTLANKQQLRKDHISYDSTSRHENLLPAGLEQKYLSIIGRILGTLHKPNTRTFNVKIGAKIFSAGVNWFHHADISLVTLF